MNQGYKNGGVLLLDKFDLCPPKVLACILAALTGSTIEIDGNQIRRRRNFRIIAILNRETVGFTSKQRNILPAEILARFRTVSFREMGRTECYAIFTALVPKYIKDGQQVVRKIVDLHADIQGHFNDTDPGHRNMNRGEATMTLRNFNTAIAMIEQGRCNLMDGCTVAAK